MARILVLILCLCLGLFLLAVVTAGSLVWSANVPARRVEAAEIEADGGHAVVLTAGRLLEYFDVGPRTAPVLVGIHGGLQTGAVFVPLAAEFPSLRIVAPTFPGQGGSSSHNGRSILSFGADVKELLDQLGIRKFMLLGASYGGPHALAIAHAMPERVTGMVLTAPVVPAMPDFPGIAGTIDDLPARFLQNTLLATPYLNRAVVKYLFKPLFSGPFAVEKLRKIGGRDLTIGGFLQSRYVEVFYLDMRRALKWNVDGPADLQETATQVRMHLPYEEIGRQLGNVPILVQAGEQDGMVSPANSRYTVDKLKKGGATNVKLVIVPGEGHFYAFEGSVKGIAWLMAEVGIH